MLRSERKEKMIMASNTKATELIEPAEAAAILGKHVKTIERYVRDGKLPAYRVGPTNKLRLKRSEVEEIRDRIVPV